MTFFFPIQNPDEGVYAAVVVNEFKLLLMKHKKFDYWFFPHGFSLLAEIPDDTVLRICREHARIIGELIDFSPIAGHDDVTHCAIPMHSEVRTLDNHRFYCSYYFVKAKNPNDMSINGDSEIEELRWFGKDDLLNINLPPGIVDVCILALEKDINVEF
jgi:ADP-ribose pyrophosphatase YjhB (NUDIX family)